MGAHTVARSQVSRAVTSMRLVSLYQSMYLICIESGITVTHRALTCRRLRTLCLDNACLLWPRDLLTLSFAPPGRLSRKRPRSTASSIASVAGALATCLALRNHTLLTAHHTISEATKCKWLRNTLWNRVRALVMF